MSKCEFCDYSNINRILFYDIIVDKCNKCNYIKIHGKDFDQLIKNFIIFNNFFNLKKVSVFDDNDIKSYNEIIKKIGNFRKSNIKEHKKCNFCNSNLYHLKNLYNKNFKIYYCKDCNSIYFEPNNFINSINKIYNNLLRNKKWYGFIFKFLEIFQG